MADGLGRGLLEIAMALISVALVTLLVNKSSQASQLVTSSASAFDNLLKTVTLQNGMGSVY